LLSTCPHFYVRIKIPYHPGQLEPPQKPPCTSRNRIWKLPQCTRSNTTLFPPGSSRHPTADSHSNVLPCFWHLRKQEVYHKSFSSPPHLSDIPKLMPPSHHLPDDQNMSIQALKLPLLFTFEKQHRGGSRGRSYLWTAWSYSDGSQQPPARSFQVGPSSIATPCPLDSYDVWRKERQNYSLSWETHLEEPICHPWDFGIV